MGMGAYHIGTTNVYQTASVVHQNVLRMHYVMLIITDKPSTSGNAKYKPVIIDIM